MSESIPPFHKYRVKNLTNSVYFDERNAVKMIEKTGSFNDTLRYLSDEYLNLDSQGSGVVAVRILTATTMTNLMTSIWKKVGDSCLEPGYVFENFIGDMKFEIEPIPESVE